MNTIPRSQIYPRILDGKKIAALVRAEAGMQVAELAAEGYEVGLAVVLVGDDPASARYVRYKHQDCKTCSIKSYDYHKPLHTSEEELLSLIDELNQAEHIHGILVQLPLPLHINTERILSQINPGKDVDGFHSYNLGKLVRGLEGLRACTPLGIMRLLDEYNIELASRHVVVVGRSTIVGKPMGLLLLERDATVSFAHSKTKNLPELCRSADIVICAVGKPRFFDASYFKEGAVVIDVGINLDENGKLCGDVDEVSVNSRVSALTPVPGGVGPMTRAMLMLNTVYAAREQLGFL